MGDLRTDIVKGTPDHYKLHNDVNAAVNQLRADFEAQGDSTGTGLRVVDYVMPQPGTSVTITHGLDHDPVGVQVFVGGHLAEGYDVAFSSDHTTVTISWDQLVAAHIRLI